MRPHGKLHITATDNSNERCPVFFLKILVWLVQERRTWLVTSRQNIGSSFPRGLTINVRHLLLVLVRNGKRNLLLTDNEFDFALRLVKYLDDSP